VTVILFVRCDKADSFGVAPSAVEAAGATLRVWDALDADGPRPTLDDVDGVVVFGSTFNMEHADEQPFIKEASELMREAMGRRIPLLGVCFGGQLLAWTLDAEVGRSPVREVGFEPIHPTRDALDDVLFSHLMDGDMAFQWHLDTFVLPQGAKLLMTGDRVINQAFRVGDLAWGTQFHLEVDGPEIEFWLEEFTHLGDLKTDWGKSPQTVLEESGRFMKEHEDRGREIITRFTILAAGSSERGRGYTRAP
jgi:GMP synthase-like glutamine amidotransferase